MMQSSLKFVLSGAAFFGLVCAGYCHLPHVGTPTNLPATERTSSMQQQQQPVATVILPSPVAESAPRFLVIHNRDASRFQQVVNEKLAAGYELRGEMQAVYLGPWAIDYSQALIKPYTTK